LGDFSQFPLPAGFAAQDAKELVGQLALMTEEVFECGVQIADDFDPEFPEERHVVFIVQPRAPKQRLVEMEAQWVKRLRSAAPDWEAVRLSIRHPE
jgi:hypothetical protein